MIERVNPTRWSAAVEVANVLGVRAICPFNDFREKLLMSRTRQAGRRTLK